MDAKGRNLWVTTWDWNAVYSTDEFPDGASVVAGLAIPSADPTAALSLWLAKYDTLGHQVWTRIISYGRRRWTTWVEATDQGAFLTVFGSDDLKAPRDAGIIEATADGAATWSLWVKEARSERLESVTVSPRIVAAAGSIWVAPGVCSDLSTQYRAWMVRAKTAGEVKWSRLSNRGYESRFESIEGTSDGGYILAGFTRAATGSRASAWAVR